MIVQVQLPDADGPPILAPWPRRPICCADYRRCTEAPGCSTAPSAASSPSPAPRRAEFLDGQVTNDVEALAPGTRLLRRVPDPQGQDARRPARARRRRRAAARSPSASRSRRCSTMIRRCAIGCDVELHKRTLEQGLLSLVGPRRRAASPARTRCPPRSTPTRAPRSAASPVAARRAPTSASTSSAPPRTPARVRAALVAAGAVAVAEAAAEIVRVEPGRPRYGVDLDDGVDPAGGRPQRARRQLHEGLLRRPGDGRAAALQGKPNRHLRGLRLSAPVAPRHAAARSASARSARVGSVVVSPRLGPIALALVRREAGPATRSRSATTVAPTAQVVDVPFA